MTLTPEQLALRKNYLGASEAAAVLGLSPFASPADIYYRKTTDADDEKPTAAMESGSRLEPVILDWAEEFLGVKLDRNLPSVIDRRTGILLATPDASIPAANSGVEAKRTSLRDLWGDPGTDHIPDIYLCQVHHQMYVMGWVKVWVPVLFIGQYAESWEMYEVEHDAQIQQALVEREVEWWNKHVVRRVPPGDEKPSLDLLKRLRRTGERVILGANGVEAWEAFAALNEKRKELAKQEDEAKAGVISLLGLKDPAEEALLPDGRLITYYSQKSAPSIDTKLLRAKWPEAFEACVQQGSHRVLRIKKGS